MYYKRFFTPAEGSYFLFGPRGTGKSTWLKGAYPEALWIDLNDPKALRTLSAAPERLEAQLEASPEKKVIVIDEVQRVPELLNVVHRAIEKKQGYRFILTGSSARKLKREGVNLLGGRASLKKMPPFYASELGADFNLEKSLILGMLPIVLNSSEPEETLRAYAGIYLKEEVQAEGLVRNLGDFARFLETMSFSHGALINVSNIARECFVARKTVESYLHILDDLLLSFHLEIFSKRAKRALSSHIKFYFFDVGVFRSLRPTSVMDRREELEGPAVEGLVAQHLKAWVDAQRELHQLQFWRTSSGVEVDFILTGPNHFYAIEVKNGATVHPSDLRGLETFCVDYPEAKPILLYRGKMKTVERGILCIPVEEFLLAVDPANPIKW